MEFLRNLLANRDQLQKSAEEQDLLDGAENREYFFTLEDGADAVQDWGASGERPNPGFVDTAKRFLAKLRRTE